MKVKHSKTLTGENIKIYNGEHFLIKNSFFFFWPYVLWSVTYACLVFVGVSHVVGVFCVVGMSHVGVSHVGVSYVGVPYVGVSHVGVSHVVGGVSCCGCVSCGHVSCCGHVPCGCVSCGCVSSTS